MITTSACMQEDNRVADYSIPTLAYCRVQPYFPYSPYSMLLDLVTNQSRPSSVSGTQENNTEVVELLEAVV